MMLAVIQKYVCLIEAVRVRKSLELIMILSNKI